jgi:D-erythronate 2-dehydrogenase
MTRVTITGAAGFLGRRLTKAIAEAGSLDGPDGRRTPVTALCLVDVAAIEPPGLPGVDVRVLKGDLSDAAFVDTIGEIGFDSLFHLASFLTFRAEEQPDQAFTVNVTALRRLIEKAHDRPKVVFTSSIAVFGSASPKTVGDDFAHAPETSYGSHKAINELLIADASRRGHIDGRSLRLPIVLTRPGAPQPNVADRIAAIIREPFRGVDVAAPLRPDTLLPLSSAGAATAALLKLHDCPAAALPATRAVNLPSLSVKAAEMAEAVTRHGARGAVRFEPDPRLQAVVDNWPARLVSERAASLGIVADADIDALIADYLTHKES